ncbi:MAG: DegT/DnrJ/EryC1/StrS family aminotransferase [Desulfosarcina sp.]|nr:DegT/DnrJ/EryC1/StrS family aminotransferase [Desulfosarcina sp.]MBC2764905.1 pyridoxal phosphate-dependent aminotransferase [Desulfosarcina sp.]
MHNHNNKWSDSLSKKRIFLSPPHMGGREIEYIKDAFESNYIAPLGPQVDAFEQEFAQQIGAPHAVAVSSGTAALHLALRYVGVQTGDEVFCPTFTFVASANAILYLGARPVFLDSEEQSWNIDPYLLSDALLERAKKGCLPKAVVLVHLYGQAADIDPIKEVCDRYEIPLIEDAAEALGATYKGKSPGTFGKAGIFSFNGNKIITTSGGGMLVAEDLELIEKCRYWATQARDPALHYEHSEMGYNYRMSNVLAAIGRGQLEVLLDRVDAKRRIFAYYQKVLGDLPGIKFMPEPAYGRATRWLSCLTVDADIAGTDRDRIIEVLAADNIEARPAWKPMHLQPLFSGCEVIGGAVAEKIFGQGVCLPSGASLTDSDLQRITTLIRSCWSS